MNYPFWEVPMIGGGLVIAIISILHVFVSHFAIGGGLFLALTERKAILKNDVSLLEYVKNHSRFFLLLTVVFGAVSGVGIWFSIGLVHPAGTSALIHNFVWGWAIEFTFFLVEIAAILIYYGTWGRVNRLLHNKIGWIYFISSYMSLVVINGILSFMLTPGRWLSTGNFWDAFFNPTYFPSLLIRTAVCIALAGLYAQLTGCWQSDSRLKAKIVRYSSKWLMVAMPILIIGGIWYNIQIPILSWQIVTGGAPPVTIFAALSIFFSILIFSFSYWIGYRQPETFTPALAALFLVLGLMVTAVTEWTREAVRKPYIIYNYMYSNSVLVNEKEKFLEEGYLSHSKWELVSGLESRVSGHDKLETLNSKPETQVGRNLFIGQCAICHTIDGYNGLRHLVRGWTEEDAYQILGKLDRIKGFMPPFVGTDEERRALAGFLADLNGRGGFQTRPYTIGDDHD
ncbi:MAG: cytochrome ubiquinol oxidase subunit I [Candidatus Omnitrophica bacterium]|nr:cytochrome ubiquinol oxidase subunit I [Candidatus Omnitrophota bacterium]